MDAVRIRNINTKERRKRLTNGIIILVISLSIFAVMVVAGVNPWWRLDLLPLFAAGAGGYFQSRNRTSTGLAARGPR